MRQSIVSHDTTNGFVIISVETKGDKSNKQAEDIVRESILTFFSAKTHNVPLLAVQEAIVFANKKLYFDADHNDNLLGERLNCAIVLIREKQVYHAYVGDNNFFIKKKGILTRITPGVSLVEDDDLFETDPVNSSVIDADLKISICDYPFNPETGDVLVLTSNSYVSTNDDVVHEIVAKSESCQGMAMAFLQYFLQNKFKRSLSFIIVKFNLLGGRDDGTSSISYAYDSWMNKVINLITSPIALLIMLGLIILLFIGYIY